MTSDTQTSSTMGGFVRKLFVAAGLLAMAAFFLIVVGGWTQVRARAVADSTGAAAEARLALQHGDFDVKAEQSAAELRLVRRELERVQTIQGYASRYGIGIDLAGAIYDVARSEGIAPAMAFRLVQVESNFKRTARSTADAFGYTQIQVPTARYYDRTVTAARLMDRDLNLKLGFRYLKDLLEQFDYDMHLALLAYNRGPARVEQILSEGGDPGNGYSNAVLNRKQEEGPLRGVAE